MPYPKEQAPADPTVEPVPPDSGHTTTTTNDAEVAPRLPHERDESSDSQNGGPRRVMQQAKDDVERGMVDTDRGPVLDDVYEKQVRTEATPQRAAPDPKP
jgi:hypothetical protein